MVKIGKFYWKLETCIKKWLLDFLMVTYSNELL